MCQTFTADQIAVETIGHAAAFAEICNDAHSEGTGLSNKKSICKFNKKCFQKNQFTVCWRKL